LADSQGIAMVAGDATGGDGIWKPDSGRSSSSAFKRARVEGQSAAVALAGEAGLRVGEVKALRWREDVDLIARTLTVNQQTRNAETTTPKGRTRCTIPMTDTLVQALKRLDVPPRGGP
jgi:integrase